MSAAGVARPQWDPEPRLPPLLCASVHHEPGFPSLRATAQTIAVIVPFPNSPRAAGPRTARVTASAPETEKRWLVVAWRGRLLIYGSLLCVRLRRGGRADGAQSCPRPQRPIIRAVPQAPTETRAHLEAQTSCSQRLRRTQTRQPVRGRSPEASPLAERNCFCASASARFVSVQRHGRRAPGASYHRCCSRGRERENIDTALCKRLTPKDFRTQSESSCIIHCR